MNIHAVEVEQIAARPLMSGFHALFSIGGFAGSGCVTAMLASQWSPWHATLLCGALMLVAMLVCGPRLLDRSGANEGPLFAFPRGIVLVLAGLAAISFLVEGAMLDWGALLVTGAGLLPRARAGLGFILFSVAMTCGRLIGDRLTAHIGDRTTLFAGGVLAIFGFITLLLLTSPVLALSGFISIGLGISNLVPILFRQTAVQKSMPQALALGAVTTCGYLGVLSGPAAIGFMAKAASLSAAFWMLAGLLCLVPVSARMVTKHRNRP